jgi:hypothetical protein
LLRLRPERDGSDLNRPAFRDTREPEPLRTALPRVSDDSHRSSDMVGTVKFEARIKELVENLPDLAVLVEPLLIVRRVLHEQPVTATPLVVYRPGFRIPRSCAVVD